MLRLLQFQKIECQYLTGVSVHEQKFTMVAVVHRFTISSNLMYYIGAGWEKEQPLLNLKFDHGSTIFGNISLVFM